VCLERLFEDVRIALDEQPVIGGVTSAMGKSCVSLSIMGAADEALRQARTTEAGISFIAVT
jgi:cobyrinic acid a,c-diamide synthase